MAIVRLYMGKGLREPCYPYREAPVFGVPFNEPDAWAYNCLPLIAGETDLFDLTGFPELHEVVVCLAHVDYPEPGLYNLAFDYLKESPRTLLYHYDFVYRVVDQTWFYAYAYIGRCSWEIDVNGPYRCEVSLSGPSSFLGVKQFEIVGITGEVQAPPEVVVGSMDAIVEGLNNASSFLYNVYLEVYDWVWPFNVISTPFYELSEVFASIAAGFSDFKTWLEEALGNISQGLTWEFIWGMILERIPNLEAIRDWFSTIDEYLFSYVSQWADLVKMEISYWIDSVVQGLQSMYNNLNQAVSQVRTEISSIWDRLSLVLSVYYWWTGWEGWVHQAFNTFIAPWLVWMRDLVDNAFIIRESLWSGWQDMRDQVVEFFTDPLGWLYDRLDDFIERYW